MGLGPYLFFPVGLALALPAFPLVIVSAASSTSWLPPPYRNRRWGSRLNASWCGSIAFPSFDCAGRRFGHRRIREVNGYGYWLQSRCRCVQGTLHQLLPESCRKLGMYRVSLLTVLRNIYNSPRIAQGVLRSQ